MVTLGNIFFIFVLQGFLDIYAWIFRIPLFGTVVMLYSEEIVAPFVWHLALKNPKYPTESIVCCDMCGSEMLERVSHAHCALEKTCRI